MTVPPAGEHGGDARRIAAWLGRRVDELLDLSASLNPLAPAVAPLVVEHLGALRHYPDPAAATAELAAAIGVDPDLVVLTNGGAEAIALVAAEEPVGAVGDPEFSLYRRHLATIDPTGPRWRSNPSCPLGLLAAPECAAAVWDEAFYPLAAGSWTRGDPATWRLGSLTKVWACPGLRIGYVIAPDPSAAESLRRRQARWAVNGLALVVVEALATSSNPWEWTIGIAELRAALVAPLRERDLLVDDTDACWVLVHRAGLRELLAAEGVVVRDCANFVLPGVARIAVPDSDGRARLLAALDRRL
jgi:histidinol-phosphate/aromatic aminotransferase/cobyric acid decarboxylase-like protein